MLVYAAALADRIDSVENIEAGTPPEVEIRAVALHAVEGLVTREARWKSPAAPSRTKLWS